MDFLLQLHFQLWHQSRAHVSLFVDTGFRLLGSFGGQSTRYSRHRPGSVTETCVGRRWWRQRGSPGRWRSHHRAAVVSLQVAFCVPDEELLWGVVESDYGHLWCPGLLVSRSPLDNATDRHDPVGLWVAHVQGRRDQHSHPYHYANNHNNHA